MPVPTKYDKVTIHGDAYYDYLWTVNRVMTNAEINTADEFTYRPEWDQDTVLLANYDNSLSGGNIVSLNEPVIAWLVYRRKENDTILQFLERIPAAQNVVIDYGVSNQTNYQYIVFPVTETTIGAPMYSEVTMSDWWNWCLMDIIPSSDDASTNIYYADLNNLWLFDVNFSSGSTSQEMEKYVYDDFTQYPKISVGLKNYASGSFDCLLGMIQNNKYSDTAEMRTKFREFAANDNLKVLKDRKGAAYIVAITSVSFQVHDESSIQPLTVDVKWTQIDDIDNYVIIENSNQHLSE